MFLGRILIFVLIFSFASLTEIKAQDESVFDTWRAQAFDSPEVDSAIKEFERQVEELESSYKRFFEEQREELMTKLEAARLEATREDELGLAIGIRDLRESVKDAELEMPSNPLYSSSSSRVSGSMKRELRDLRTLIRNNKWHSRYFDKDMDKEFVFENIDLEWRLVIEHPHRNGSGTSTLIYFPETESFRGVFVRPSYQDTRTFETFRTQAKQR